VSTGCAIAETYVTLSKSLFEVKPLKLFMPASESTPPAWTFLSNHSHVLLLICADPGVKLRDVADAVGITERAVQRIVADLEAAGYLERERVGRRNHYRVHARLPLRHRLESHIQIGSLLDLLLKKSDHRSR
jgi:DNA-binding transcriptional ArsR family regulator